MHWYVYPFSILLTPPASFSLPFLVFLQVSFDLVFFKVENNSLELTRIFQNIFIDPIVSARKKRRRREVDMKREREKERKRRFGVNAIISRSCVLNFVLRNYFSGPY